MSKIILLGGGSASGKSLFADAINEYFSNRCTIINIDSYCVSHDELPLEERAKINYDTPDAYDSNLLLKDLKTLIDGKEIDIPIYDFSNHLRSTSTLHVAPAEYLIIDGIFALYYKNLLNIADLKIYIDAKEGIRLNRRIARDTTYRGRSLESVLAQFHATVKPMHDLYIEPTKENADIIIVNNSFDGLEKESLNEVYEAIEKL